MVSPLILVGAAMIFCPGAGMILLIDDLGAIRGDSVGVRNGGEHDEADDRPGILRRPRQCDRIPSSLEMIACRVPKPTPMIRSDCLTWPLTCHAYLFERGPPRSNVYAVLNKLATCYTEPPVGGGRAVRARAGGCDRCGRTVASRVAIPQRSGCGHLASPRGGPPSSD